MFMTLLAGCVALSMYAADDQNGKNVKNVKRMRIEWGFGSLKKALTMALGENHDYNNTAMGIDFDETVGFRRVPINRNLSAEILLNGELKTADNYAYEIAQEVKEELGFEAGADLFTEALKLGGHIDLIKFASPGKQDDREAKIIATDLRENAEHVYTEDLAIIKAPIKEVQTKGAFVTIASAGAGTTERKNVAKQIGVLEANWAAGPDKYINLMAIAKENYTAREGWKPGDKETVYDTIILIDNAEPGIDSFIASALKDRSSSIRNIVGIIYDKPEHRITKEKIIEEFNKIAGKKESPKSSSWLGYYGDY